MNFFDRSAVFNWKSLGMIGGAAQPFFVFTKKKTGSERSPIRLFNFLMHSVHKKHCV